jgi:DNA-binding transcriptional ArsR family regulator
MILDNHPNFCYTIFNQLVKCKGGSIVGIQNTMKALADPIRREILERLRADRLPAGEIASKFSVSGAAISKHLSILREADLIRDTREGKYIFYELNTSVLEEVMLWLSGLKGEKHD